MWNVLMSAFPSKNLPAYACPGEDKEYDSNTAFHQLAFIQPSAWAKHWIYIISFNALNSLGSGFYYLPVL